MTINSTPNYIGCTPLEVIERHMDHVTKTVDSYCNGFISSSEKLRQFLDEYRQATNMLFTVRTSRSYIKMRASSSNSNSISGNNCSLITGSGVKNKPQIVDTTLIGTKTKTEQVSTNQQQQQEQRNLPVSADKDDVVDKQITTNCVDNGAAGCTLNNKNYPIENLLQQQQQHPEHKNEKITLMDSIMTGISFIFI